MKSQLGSGPSGGGTCAKLPDQVLKTPLRLPPAAATARAGNRRKWRLGALRAHTKAPYEMDFHRETPRR